MEFCLKERIKLLFILSYFSHVLQSLNLSIFAAVKARYRKEIAKFMTINLNNIRRSQFITAYEIARQNDMNRANIEAG